MLKESDDLDNILAVTFDTKMTLEKRLVRPVSRAAFHLLAWHLEEVLVSISR